MIKIETHVHTKFSKDSLLAFGLLYLKCRIKGIQCIAITEHNNITGGVQFKKFCEKHGNKIHVIVGEEVFSEQGEIIGLFLKKEIPAGLSASNTIEEIINQDGLVYVPHPYDEKRKDTVLIEEEIENNKELIDCIEIHNGRNISPEFDIKQKAIAQKYNLTGVIGSDAHTLIEIGRNYMEFKKIPHNPEEFIDCLANVKFHEKSCIKSAHHITKMAKTIKLLRAGKFSVIFEKIKKKIKAH